MNSVIFLMLVEEEYVKLVSVAETKLYAYRIYTCSYSASYKEKC